MIKRTSKKAILMLGHISTSYRCALVARGVHLGQGWGDASSTTCSVGFSGSAEVESLVGTIWTEHGSGVVGTVGE
jgi:hypothetical protein